jgi:hypothetical protein
MDWSDDQEETLMTDAEFEAYMAANSDGTNAPPLFALMPPPPPPPWLEALPGCYGTGNCAETPQVTSVEGDVGELVRTVAVIVVSSLVIVVTLVLGAAMLLRRWRAGRKQEREEEREEQELEGKTVGQAMMLHQPRTTNLYISEQQLMVEVGRGASEYQPAPALIIGGVPFHLVHRVGEGGVGPEPVYESIDSSEFYSDLSSLGSSGGGPGSDRGSEELPRGPPRLLYSRPLSSQSGVRPLPQRPLPLSPGGSLPGGWWSPGPQPWGSDPVTSL